MARPHDLIIKNGTVVTASESFIADVAVSGGRIAALGRFDDPAARTVEARGMVVIPGGVDVHTHLDMPLAGGVTADDFESGSMGALFGGTTSIIDFATPDKGAPLREGLEARMRKAEDRSSVDYGFHMVVYGATEKTFREMDQLVREGVTSFKLFMAYPDRFMSTDETILQALLRTRDNGGLVCLHAENGWIIEDLVRKALAEGRTSPRFHPLTRPESGETEAVARAIALAATARAPVYIMHLSAAGALDEVRRARRNGAGVFAETCPQYLYLNDDVYSQPEAEAAKFVMSPPLRPKATSARLWQGLRNNDLQVVATDHCSFFMKPAGGRPCKLGKKDFSKIPGGAPGIETRLPLLWEAVQKGRISMNRFVELTSTAPAKLFGLYPRKGHLSPGAEADIVVIDPKKPFTISSEHHHLKVDYNPYEGKTIHGSIRDVFLRGQSMIRDGRFVGRAGAGRFLHRAPRDD